MLIVFIVLGSLAFIGSMICAATIKDWKPRYFLSLYSDLFFLAASIAAEKVWFILLFAAFSMISLIGIILRFKKKH